MSPSAQTRISLYHLQQFPIVFYSNFVFPSPKKKTRQKISDKDLTARYIYYYGEGQPRKKNTLLPSAFSAWPVSSFSRLSLSPEIFDGCI